VHDVTATQPYHSRPFHYLALLLLLRLLLVVVLGSAAPAAASQQQGAGGQVEMWGPDKTWEQQGYSLGEQQQQQDHPKETAAPGQQQQYTETPIWCAGTQLRQQGRWHAPQGLM
jgi:hypothetical protein